MNSGRCVPGDSGERDPASNGSGLLRRQLVKNVKTTVKASDTKAELAEPRTAREVTSGDFFL